VRQPDDTRVVNRKGALGSPLWLSGPNTPIASTTSINADLCPEVTATIEAFCRERGVEVGVYFPFDTTVTQAMVQGVPVTTYDDGSVVQALCHMWEQPLAALET
jgi:MinD superfamily P-loop ATPase